MSYEIRPTTREEALVRAMIWRQRGIYDIGHGNGNDPHADSPLDDSGKCDCSNLAHWIIGSVLDRGSDGYYNTDGMLFDAYGIKKDGTKTEAPQRVFTSFEGDPEPGDLIVKGGVYEKQNGVWRRVHAGHVGVFTLALPGYSRSLSFRAEGYAKSWFVHCSTFGNKPPSIRETDGRYWRQTGYLIRYKDFA